MLTVDDLGRTQDDARVPEHVSRSRTVCPRVFLTWNDNRKHGDATWELMLSWCMGEIAGLFQLRWMSLASCLSTHDEMARPQCRVWVVVPLV
ncbi:hypothetical protein CLOP_g13212 [Closterium sp. NIES-67]|nr:hypothetical protein CLOP_g13212 [Closterium sp. NIES-67]